MIFRKAILKASAAPSIRRAVTTSRAFRPLVSRFIAGDTLEEALGVAERLLGQGMRVSLDYLGENTSSEAEALEAKRTYIQMLERIDGVDAVRKWRAEPKGYEPLNISIKLTQCGLDLGDAFAENNLRDVLDVARGLQNFVRVDMEASEYTERTVQIMTRVLADYDNTGTVLQSYLHRTPEDVETMIRIGARTRLVKGAYLEPPTVAYPEKEKVDAVYVQEAKRLLEAGKYPAIATQDEAIIRELNSFVAERKIDPKSFEYQMIYGVRRDLQETLALQGFNVRIYVPFGDSWYPYFTRRLAERPANVGFIVKSLIKG